MQNLAPPHTFMSLKKMKLRVGFYHFSTEIYPCTLRLIEHDKCIFTEIAIAPKAPITLKMESGDYELQIALPSRVVEFSQETIKILPFNLSMKLRLAIKKIQSLGLGKFIEKAVKFVFSGKKNNGAAISETSLEFATSYSKNYEILASQEESLKNTIIQNIDFTNEFENFCKNLLIIDTKIEVKNNADYQYILYKNKSETFAKDYLYIVFMAAKYYSDKSCIIFDKWINDKPCWFPVFDPLLHQKYDIEIPKLIKKGFEINSETIWQAENFAKFNAPICHSNNEIINNDNPLNITKKTLTSIIIPTRDRADLLKHCVDAILEKTDNYFEIIILNNQSKEVETYDLFKTLSEKGIRIINCDFKFNFAKLCNIGAQNSNGDILLFVNNDIEILSHDWLKNLIELASQPKIGIVGANLLFPNNNIQHCGIYFGFANACGHMFSNGTFDDLKKHYFLSNNSLKTSLTGALIAIERTKFYEIGQFDEVNFAVEYNDVDLCLKSIKFGYYNALASNVTAYHLESASRNTSYSTEYIKQNFRERKLLWQKWYKNIEEDKCKNPYFRSDTIGFLYK